MPLICSELRRGELRQICLIPFDNIFLQIRGVFCMMLIFLLLKMKQIIPAYLECYEMSLKIAYLSSVQ